MGGKEKASMHKGVRVGTRLLVYSPNVCSSPWLGLRQVVQSTYPMQVARSQ